MTPLQLRERFELAKADAEKAVAASQALLDATLAGPVTVTASSIEWKAINNAAVQLRACVDRLAVMSAGIEPYLDPDFYAELKPSRALDDGGLWARDHAEQAFPE